MGLLRLVGKGSECHCYHTIFVRLGDGAAIFPLRNGHSFSRLWVLELLRKMGGRFEPCRQLQFANGVTSLLS